MPTSALVVFSRGIIAIPPFATLIYCPGFLASLGLCRTLLRYASVPHSLWVRWVRFFGHGLLIDRRSEGLDLPVHLVHLRAHPVVDEAVLPGVGFGFFEFRRELFDEQILFVEACGDL